MWLGGSGLRKALKNNIYLKDSTHEPHFRALSKTRNFSWWL
jgi:hypothetical protein